MKNENVLVNNFIEEYEEKLYDKYRLYKGQYGRFCDTTTKVHTEWKQILKFIYDYHVDGKFTLKMFKAALDELGANLNDRKNEEGFPEYWAAISTMYYKIEQQVGGLYSREVLKTH